MKKCNDVCEKSFPDVKPGDTVRIKGAGDYLVVNLGSKKILVGLSDGNRWSDGILWSQLTPDEVEVINLCYKEC